MKYITKRINFLKNEDKLGEIRSSIEYIRFELLENCFLPVFIREAYKSTLNTLNSSLLTQPESITKIEKWKSSVETLIFDFIDHLNYECILFKDVLQAKCPSQAEEYQRWNKEHLRDNVVGVECLELRGPTEEEKSFCCQLLPAGVELSTVEVYANGRKNIFFRNSSGIRFETQSLGFFKVFGIQD